MLVVNSRHGCVIRDLGRVWGQCAGAVVFSPSPGRRIGCVVSMRAVPWPDPDPVVAAAIRAKYAGRRVPLAVAGRGRLGPGVGGGAVRGGVRGPGPSGAAPGAAGPGVGVREGLGAPLRRPDQYLAADGPGQGGTGQARPAIRPGRVRAGGGVL